MEREEAWATLSAIADAQVVEAHAHPKTHMAEAIGLLEDYEDPEYSSQSCRRCGVRINPIDRETHSAWHRDLTAQIYLHWWLMNDLRQVIQAVAEAAAEGFEEVKGHLLRLDPEG
jgi:hypothetical protein